MSTAGTPQFANIGKSLSIKGELSGNEDVFMDGRLEGSIQLSGNNLTVGPNGRIQANVAARNVTVAGELNGNIQASERTELQKTAVVNGDVQTRRIAIAEGAFFRGKLEIIADTRSQAATGTATSPGSGATSSPRAGGSEHNK
jgi:cytoskeletal protein CcmA (bactofilin family)